MLRGLDGRFCLADVRSHVNPNMCATFGANRSSRLAVVPDVLIVHPLVPVSPVLFTIPCDFTGSWAYRRSWLFDINCSNKCMPVCDIG